MHRLCCRPLRLQEHWGISSAREANLYAVQRIAGKSPWRLREIALTQIRWALRDDTRTRSANLTLLPMLLRLVSRTRQVWIKSPT